MNKMIIAAAVICVLAGAGFGQEYPMLEDVRAVSVSIDHAGTEPNKEPIHWPRMQLHLARMVSEAGINIEPVKGIRLAGIPDLRVTVMTAWIAETEQIVFHIETCLYRIVGAGERSDIMISTPVWADAASMQKVAEEDADSAITKAAAKQVGRFIEDWEATQKKKETAAEPNNKDSVADRGQTPAIGVPAAEQKNDPNAQKYLASKNGKVFHCAQCPTAKGLSRDNLITFASKDEAINSGKRACRRCKP